MVLSDHKVLFLSLSSSSRDRGRNEEQRNNAHFNDSVINRNVLSVCLYNIHILCTICIAKRKEQSEMEREPKTLTKHEWDKIDKACVCESQREREREYEKF